MAPDDLNEQDDIQVAPEPKAKSNMLIIILVLMNFLLILGLAAWFIFFQDKGDAGKSGQGASNVAEGEESIEDSVKSAAVGPIIQLDPFLVNLDEPGSNRYLKAVIQLEVTTPEEEAEVKNRAVQLRDLILTYLSSLTYSQTQGVVNKDIIRTTLIKQINKAMVSGKIAKLYFTEFVIQ